MPHGLTAGLEPPTDEGVQANQSYRTLLSMVGFTDADQGRLQALHAGVVSLLPPIIDRFYAETLAQPGAAKVITGGAPQVDRLRSTQTAWAESLFVGPFDDAYFQRIAWVGRVHVQIGLAPVYVFGAMSIMRRELHAALRSLDASSEDHRSLDRLLDIQLALMIETYSDRDRESAKQAERFAAIGEVAAAVAHDLRNPLAVIESSTALLRRGVDENDARAIKHLDRIHEYSQLATGVVVSLLDRARGRKGAHREADLETVVEDALRQLSHLSVPTLVDITGPLVVRVDVDGFRQMLVNLLLNAMEAVAGKHVADPPPDAVSLKAFARGKDLALEVRDQGPGIPPEAQPSVFTPLYTTKPDGTGLGLSVCKQVVRAHHGEITAENHPNGGAVFSLNLPGIVVKDA